MLRPLRRDKRGFRIEIIEWTVNREESAAKEARMKINWTSSLKNIAPSTSPASVSRVLPRVPLWRLEICADGLSRGGR